MEHASKPVTLFATVALAVLASARPSAGDTRPIRFQRLSLDEGLSQTTILSILQDRQGFMWFGTEDGLNRYDGAQVTIYARDASNPESLPNNVVWATAEDAAGDIWVATEGGGIARWERRRDRFVRYGTREGLASDNVRALVVDRAGLVWIGTRDAGLDSLDPRTGAVRHYRHRADQPGSLSDDSVYAIAEDRSGVLWIGTNGGLDRLASGRDALVRFGHDAKNEDSLADNHVRSLFQDAEGTLWIGTEGGGLSALSPAGRFQRWRSVRGDRQSLSNDAVRAVLEDDAGRMWVGTRHGLNLFEREGGRFQHYLSNPADPRSLGDDEIMSLYQDQGGVLWVGTRSAGVHRWNPRAWSFGHHRADANDPQSLSQDYVTAFSMAPSGRLFVGTFGGGLDAFDRSARTVEHYRHRPHEPGSLSDDRVMALLHDRRGRLWVGTMDGGLNLFDAATGTFRAYRHDPARADSLSSDAVMSLFEDRRGTLWVGTFRGGLNRLDPAGNTFTHYRHVAGDSNTLGSDSVTAMAEDASGALWVGTDSGGLGLLRPETGQVRTFWHDPADPHSLPSNTVFGLLVEGSRVWVGTRGGGLAVLEQIDQGKGVFRTYTERDGLPNGVVYGIHPDSLGNLWLSTNAGLAVLDRQDGRFRTYGVMHGLQSKEFNFGAHYRSGAGEMFFGGPQGFNAFIPESLHQGVRSPRLALTGLLKLNVPVSSEVPVQQLEEVQLDHRDQVVTFEFAALDYAAPELNRYAYMLEGFDTHWMDLGRFRRVTYTNLDAGRYVLRVKAWNADGVASERPLALRVRVLPPPWRTWWAWLGYAIIVAAAAWAVVRSQRRQRHREAQYRRQLETEVQTRTRELAQQNSRLEELNGRLLETSLSDSLTGLRNRRFFFEEVAREVAVLQRSAQQHGERETRRLVFIMVDLDWFKPINDTCGHSVGDRVLLQVKDILVTACRRSDILVRWGGDEFLVVGEETDAARIETIPERVRAAIEKTAFDLGNGQVARLTCSLGFTSFPWNRTQDLGRATVEQVLALADAALYMAKKAGRNCWVGLLGTERTTVEDVVRSTQDRPERLVESGNFVVTSSKNTTRRPVEADEPLQRAAPGA